MNKKLNNYFCIILILMSINLIFLGFNVYPYFKFLGCILLIYLFYQFKHYNLSFKRSYQLSWMIFLGYIIYILLNSTPLTLYHLPLTIYMLMIDMLLLASYLFFLDGLQKEQNKKHNFKAMLIAYFVIYELAVISPISGLKNILILSDVIFLFVLIITLRKYFLSLTFDFKFTSLPIKYKATLIGSGLFTILAMILFMNNYTVDTKEITTTDQYDLGALNQLNNELPDQELNYYQESPSKFKSYEDEYDYYHATSYVTYLSKEDKNSKRTFIKLEPIKKIDSAKQIGFKIINTDNLKDIEVYIEKDGTFYKPDISFTPINDINNFQIELFNSAYSYYQGILPYDQEVTYYIGYSNYPLDNSLGYEVQLDVVAYFLQLNYPYVPFSQREGKTLLQMSHIKE